MTLSRILITELQDLQIIELCEEDGSRTFPILIGISEAEAIGRRLRGMPVKRPLTHELLDAVIKQLGGIIESVAITDLSDHTFYAVINIRNANGELIEIDARPSDAIALVCANEDIPIFVAEHVLDEAATGL
ncbi:MAG: bifunctional nuclease family protein [Planctomycetota bacterium]